jgi:hypothetical protein
VAEAAEEVTSFVIPGRREAANPESRGNNIEIPGLRLRRIPE